MSINNVIFYNSICFNLQNLTYIQNPGKFPKQLRFCNNVFKTTNYKSQLIFAGYTSSFTTAGTCTYSFTANAGNIQTEDQLEKVFSLQNMT